MSHVVENPFDQPFPAVPEEPVPHRPAVAPRWPWAGTWAILLSLAAIGAAAMVAAVHGARGFFLPSLAILICLLASLFDGWTHRIPNHLTYPAILIGLALNGLAPLLDALHLHTASVWLGAAGWQSSGAGFLICAFLALAASLLAGVHGGDVKLLAALGAMLGLLETANVLFIALAAAIAYALINLALFGRLNAVISRAAMRILELVYLRRLNLPEEQPASRASHVPMAVPLFIGIAVAEYLRMRGIAGMGAIR